MRQEDWISHHSGQKVKGITTPTCLKFLLSPRSKKIIVKFIWKGKGSKRVGGKCAFYSKILYMSVYITYSKKWAKFNQTSKSKRMKRFRKKFQQVWASNLVSLPDLIFSKPNKDKPVYFSLFITWQVALPLVSLISKPFPLQILEPQLKKKNSLQILHFTDETQGREEIFSRSLSSSPAKLELECRAFACSAVPLLGQQAPSLFNTQRTQTPSVNMHSVGESAT